MTNAGKASLIVKELLGRSTAGVFAMTDPDGEIVADWKIQTEWTDNLGLASFLQHAAFDNVSDTQRSMAEVVRAELSQTYHEPIRWSDRPKQEDLSLVATNALVAELYRFETLTWVLSLRRPVKTDHSRVWDGAMWMGSGLVCMGLAAMLQRLIAGQVGEALDKQLGHDPIRALEVRALQVLKPLLSTQQWDSKHAAASFTYLAHEAHRLRDQASRTEDSLQHFMQPRPLDPPTEPPSA